MTMPASPRRLAAATSADTPVTNGPECTCGTSKGDFESDEPKRRDSSSVAVLRSLAYVRGGGGIGGLEAAGNSSRASRVRSSWVS